jgi:predicted MFS family arabinose efflux permease
MGVSFVSVLASAFAPNFGALEVLRFVGGFGIGLFFPPIVVLAVRNIGVGSGGVGSALIVTSFAIGGAIGVFGWSVLSSEYGWRTSLLIQAVITLLSTLAFLVSVPDDVKSPGKWPTRANLGRAITNPTLMIVSLALFGSGITGSAVSFLVYYIEVSFSVQPAVAGFISGIGYLTLLPTALLGGRLYDTGRSGPYIMLAATATMAIGTCLIAVHSLYAALVGAVIGGLGVGPIGTIALVIAKKTASSPEVETLAISIGDTFSLAGVFVGALVFPLLVLAGGYPVAWFVTGAVCFFLTIPVLRIKDAQTERPQEFADKVGGNETP